MTVFLIKTVRNTWRGSALQNKDINKQKYYNYYIRMHILDIDVVRTLLYLFLNANFKTSGSESESKQISCTISLNAKHFLKWYHVSIRLELLCQEIYKIFIWNGNLEITFDKLRYFSILTFHTFVNFRYSGSDIELPCNVVLWSKCMEVL